MKAESRWPVRGAGCGRTLALFLAVLLATGSGAVAVVVQQGGVPAVSKTLAWLKGYREGYAAALGDSENAPAGEEGREGR